MVSLSECLNDCFQTITDQNGRLLIVNSEGYRFGVVFEKEEKIQFFQSNSESKQILFKFSDIREVTRCTGEELEMIAISNQGKIIKAAFTGFSNEDPRSNIESPSRHGGVFQDMETLLNLHPKLKEGIWTDELTGNRYINLKELNGKDESIIIPDATVDIRKMLERDSKEYWGTPLNFKKSDIIDELEKIAMNQKRNPFLEWVAKPFEDTGPVSIVTPENLLTTVGATAPGLSEEEKQRIYLSNLIPMFMLATIGRQYEPDIVDVAIILIGPQETGKTQLCRRLGNRWYRATGEDVHDQKKLMESTNGGVVVEFREGQQILKPESLKNFLDFETLQYRKPYDRVEREYPIKAGIWITTNDMQPLIDITGARRLIPVYMTGDVEGSCWPIDIPEETYRRLWAEMKARYDRGERWRDYWNRIKPLAKIMQKYATTSPPYYDRVKVALSDFELYQKIPNEDLMMCLTRELGEREAEKVRGLIKKSPDAYDLERIKSPFRMDDKEGRYRGYTKIR